MKKSILVLIGFILFSSCSTIRLKYESKFKTIDNKTGDFAYEKSYDVGSIQTWCIITGIIYGGACWGYLGLPYTDHKKFIEKDAQLKLGEVLGTPDFQVKDFKIDKVNWEKQLENFNISYSNTSLHSPPRPELNENKINNGSDERQDEEREINEFIR